METVYPYPNANGTNFLKPAQSCDVKGYQFDYLGFRKPNCRSKTPVVIFGGAFQNFLTFRADVENLIDLHPVILVALPGQSHNRQRINTSDLSFVDFAKLINQFLDKINLQKIYCIGYSYGSSMAYSLASCYPDRVDKLILAGTTLKIRTTLKQFLKASIWLLKHKGTKPFAEGVCQHLFNHSFQKEIGFSDTIVSRLYQSISSLSQAEAMQSYVENTDRLCDYTLPDAPISSRTLVCASNFDHFIMPYETYQVFQNCTNADFALIENGDHMFMVEQPRTFLTLFRQFIEGKRLQQPGALINEEASSQIKDKRKLLRIKANEPVTIENIQGKKAFGRMTDFNQDGCLIHCDDPSFLSNTSPFTPQRLSFDSYGMSLSVNLEPTKKGFRGIFFKDSFKEMERFLQTCQNFKN